ncbi:MAG: methylamine dehydrogenase [Myxococcota bacterium]
MIPALVVSQVVLLLLVVALAGVVFALARQLGVLHERVAPAGALALSGGPRVGEAAPQVAASSLAGTLAHIGSPSGEGVSQLLFFLSPRCPVCKTLLPTVQRLARSHGVRLLCASDGAEDDHAALAREYGLALEDYFVSTDVGLRYGIAKLPYAVLLDGEGIVRAQGIVNTREHVESLFEAEALGVASIQDYLAASNEVRAEGARA